MKIFVGSSSEPEALKVLEFVCRILEQLRVEVFPWEDGVFKGTHYTLGDILQTSKICDGGIFIIHEDDRLYKSKVEDKEHAQSVVRDNVLLETGIFYGALGKNASLLYFVGEPHKPSDLDGITVINHNWNEHFRIKEKIEDWINELKAQKEQNELEKD